MRKTLATLAYYLGFQWLSHKISPSVHGFLRCRDMAKAVKKAVDREIKRALWEGVSHDD